LIPDNHNIAETFQLRPSEDVEKGAQDRPKVDVIIADCGEVNTSIMTHIKLMTISL